MFIVVFVLSTFVKNSLFTSEIGIVNAANVFRGEAQLEGFGLWSKIIENRYLFYLLALLIKLLALLDPLIYFTNQARVFPFFANPPIWIGLLPLFILGLWYVINKARNLLILIIGILPGVLFVKTYDFEKLILLSPFIILTTIMGLRTSLVQKSYKYKMVLIICLIFVAIQILMFIPDYIYREPLRFRYL